jgi:GNAT superfamily N-acetyltransferase
MDCQQQLSQALQARIRATEEAIGQQFAFEIIERANTTAFLAHRWPRIDQSLPFHRIFHYCAPLAAHNDPWLDRIVNQEIDVIIEVLPGSHQAHTADLLRTYQFQPVWQIPWLALPLEHMTALPYGDTHIQQVAPTDLAAFAEILCDGYGYQGPSRTAWQTFAQHGYQAPGFVCFLAVVDQQPAAAGVLHLNGNLALVDGAATLPHYRGRGLQKALLMARLTYAQQHGATYAFSRTGAGSISHANLEKLGMQLLVESTAWRRLYSNVHNH